VSEDDETERTGISTTSDDAPEDNSLGRLLTLSDGIFAIAMTLLALDLSVPDVTGHVTNAKLTHALADHADSYWTFLLTFYVVWGYWVRHRRLMRSVIAVHANLIRDTFVLLVLVAAMPFPASLLGRYGGYPIALALYGAVNALATLTLIVMREDVRRLGLTEAHETDDEEFGHRWRSWLTFGVFVLCIPAAYLFRSHGPFVLILLAIPDRFMWLRNLVHRRTSY
jgi:uncharacterized membrane protein